MCSPFFWRFEFTFTKLALTGGVLWFTVGVLGVHRFPPFEIPPMHYIGGLSRLNSSKLPFHRHEAGIDLLGFPAEVLPDFARPLFHHLE
jgi:hypothetical protein